jgi:hypothetical protein
MTGRGKKLSDVGGALGHRRAATDRDDHQRNVGLLPKNFARRRIPCAVPSTPSSTVAPATPRRRSSSTTSAKRRLAADALLAPGVDRQLGRLLELRGQRNGADRR